MTKLKLLLIWVLVLLTALALQHDGLAFTVLAVTTLFELFMFGNVYLFYYEYDKLTSTNDKIEAQVQEFTNLQNKWYMKYTSYFGTVMRFAVTVYVPYMYFN